MDIKQNLTPAVISYNEADLIAYIDNTLEELDGYIVNEDDTAGTRQILANLNKLVDDMQKSSKSIKNDILKPYEVFDKSIKAQCQRVLERRATIDIQLKNVEEKAKQAKLIEVQKAIKEIQQEKNCFCDVPINEKWLNKSTKLDDVKAQVSNVIMEHQLGQINGSNLKVRDVRLTYEEKHRQAIKELFESLEKLGIKYEIL